MISYIQEFRVETAGVCILHVINELSDVTDLNLVAQNEEANRMLTHNLTESQLIPYYGHVN